MKMKLTKSKTIGGPILSQNKMKLIYVSKHSQITTLGTKLQSLLSKYWWLEVQFKAYLADHSL